jgi:hypothetical protein
MRLKRCEHSLDSCSLHSQRLYVVGSNSAESHFKILKIDRTTNDLVISDEAVTYEKHEVDDLLTMIHEGNKGLGGMKKVATAVGLLGWEVPLYRLPNRFHTFPQWLLFVLYHCSTPASKHWETQDFCNR